MKKELEEALRNINVICENARLSRNEHIVLSNNLELIRNTIIEAEKPKKEKMTNAPK